MASFRNNVRHNAHNCAHLEDRPRRVGEKEFESKENPFINSNQIYTQYTTSNHQPYYDNGKKVDGRTVNTNFPCRTKSMAMFKSQNRTDTHAANKKPLEKFEAPKFEMADQMSTLSLKNTSVYKLQTHERQGPNHCRQTSLEIVRPAFYTERTQFPLVNATYDIQNEHHDSKNERSQYSAQSNNQIGSLNHQSQTFPKANFIMQPYQEDELEDGFENDGDDVRYYENTNNCTSDFDYDSNVIDPRYREESSHCLQSRIALFDHHFNKKDVQRGIENASQPLTRTSKPNGNHRKVVFIPEKGWRYVTEPQDSPRKTQNSDTRPIEYNSSKEFPFASQKASSIYHERINNSDNSKREHSSRLMAKREHYANPQLIGSGDSNLNASPYEESNEYRIYNYSNTTSFSNQNAKPESPDSMISSPGISQRDNHHFRGRNNHLSNVSYPESYAERSLQNPEQIGDGSQTIIVSDLSFDPSSTSLQEIIDCYHNKLSTLQSWYQETVHTLNSNLQQRIGKLF